MFHRLQLLFLSALLSGFCLAQDTPPFYIEHYTDEDGLPQNSVKFIAPDENGFIWMSTEDGLVRFDGNHFLRFSKDNMNVSSSRFQTLYTGIDAPGLFCYNDRGEQVKIEKGAASRDSINTSLTQRLARFDVNNRRHSGSWYADAGTNTSRNTRSGDRRILITVRNYNAYIYNGDTLTYYENDRIKQTFLFRTKDDWKFFLINERLYLLDANGHVNSFFPHQHPALVGDILNNARYKNGGRDIAVFRNICIPDQVIFYLNQSFYLVTQRGDGVLATTLLFSGFDAAGQNISTALYQRETGKLYLGSNTKGLFVLSPNLFQTLTNPDAENIFYSQAVFGNNHTISKDGLVFDLSASPPRVEKKRKAISSDFFSFFTDAKGFIWTKRLYSLNKYEPAGFGLSSTWKLPGTISVVHKGKNGKVWVGMSNKIFLLNDDAQTDSLALFLSLPASVTYMQQVADDTLFANTENELFRIQISTRKTDTIHAMKGKMIRSIYTSVPGETWITTYGDGFFLYKDEKLTKFPLDRNNFLATSHYIIEDKKGFFWIPTNKGLFQAAKADLLAYANGVQQELYYHYYDKKDGFFTNEFNGGCEPCAVKLDNGYVSLPSMNGLVVFKPDSLQVSLPGKELFIDRIELDDRVIRQEYLMHLPRQFGQLNIYISTPYAGNANNVQFDYALVTKRGRPGWIPASANGLISFSSIPSGDYTLLIRKLNGFGQNNYIQKEISIVVAPAWYNTIAFYVGAILLLSAFSWLFVRMRYGLIKKRNSLLERTVAEKTKELQWQTTIQEKIIRSVSHDIQTPLQYQRLLSDKLYQSLLDANALPHLPAAKVVNDSTHRLYYMVDNLLKYLKAQLLKEPAGAEPIDLFNIAQEKVLIFKPMAAEKMTLLTNHINVGVFLPGNIRLIVVILHNLLDNAVKVTRNGRIDINAKLQDDQFCLTVTDSGPGIPAIIQDWLNSPVTEQEKRSSEIANLSGIGLLMVRELSVLLNLELSVSAIAGKGTRFSVSGKFAGPRS